MGRTWIYKANRTEPYFHGELNKFIKVAQNHARNEKTQWVYCPCKACKNLRVFSDPTTIRSHVIVSGFVKDYMIWKKHGETDAPPPTNNPPDEMILDEKFDRMFDAYIDDDGEGDDDGVGGFHGDDVDDGPIDGKSSDEEIDDGDFLSQLLRNTEVEVLVADARGLPNFDTVRKSAEKNIYERSKGCPKHWTVLHFVIAVEAKFKDLLRATVVDQQSGLLLFNSAQEVGQNQLVVMPAPPPVLAQPSTCAQSSVASTTGELYPVDRITTTTPCLLLYLIGRAGKTK